MKIFTITKCVAFDLTYDVTKNKTKNEMSTNFPVSTLVTCHGCHAILNSFMLG